MNQVVTIGLDIAKSVFQLHGVDAAGAVVLRKRLTRSRMLPFFEKQAPCIVGVEACGSAHYWARELGCHESEFIAKAAAPLFLRASGGCSHVGSSWCSESTRRRCCRISTASQSVTPSYPLCAIFSNALSLKAAQSSHARSRAMPRRRLKKMQAFHVGI